MGQESVVTVPNSNQLHSHDETTNVWTMPFSSGERFLPRMENHLPNSVIDVVRQYFMPQDVLHDATILSSVDLEVHICH